MKNRFKFRIWNGAEMHYNDFVVTPTGYVAKLNALYDVEYDNEKDEEKEIQSENEFMIDNSDLDFEKDKILMQCTGLKDKNGKLIYEGDIVKNHGWWNASGPAGYEKDTCVVEFDKSVCGFTPMCNYDCDCCVYHEAEDLEVIGNIYENEDLLKCENQ